MSHDRKPGRMRVVGGATGTPERRRNDAEQSAPVAIAVVPVAPKRSGRLLAALFVTGCALGGAALPLARAL